MPFVNLNTSEEPKKLRGRTESSLRTGSLRERKKIGERSVNPRAKHTPSSPDRSRLAPLVLDYTRLSRPKPNREPVRRLNRETFTALSTHFTPSTHLSGLYGSAPPPGINIDRPFSKMAAENSNTVE